MADTSVERVFVLVGGGEMVAERVRCTEPETVGSRVFVGGGVTVRVSDGESLYVKEYVYDAVSVFLDRVRVGGGVTVRVAVGSAVAVWLFLPLRSRVCVGGGVMLGVRVRSADGDPDAVRRTVDDKEMDGDLDLVCVGGGVMVHEADCAAEKDCVETRVLVGGGVTVGVRVDLAEGDTVFESVLVSERSADRLRLRVCVGGGVTVCVSVASGDAL